jgi:TPR repeat protein
MRPGMGVLCAIMLLVLLPARAQAAPEVTPELKTAITHPLVQNNLAVIYAEGRGVPQDYRKAAEWFRKAAEQGDAFAQSSLAYLYTEGQGVPQDYFQAAEWYKKAALQGDTRAQFHLGLLYYRGKGVAKDHSQAASWFFKAAKAGDREARYYLTKTSRPQVMVVESKPGMGKTPVETTADGIGLTFLQGAGATVGAEMAYFWILAPVLCLFAL